jgi:hypothetical protein
MLDGVSSLPPYYQYGYSELTCVQPKIGKIDENELVGQPKFKRNLAKLASLNFLN